jgi:hypothetical protein
MRPLLWFLLVGTTLAPWAAPAHAAPPDLLPPEAPILRGDTIRLGEAVQEIRLVDGSIIYGRVREASDERIVVETPAGIRIEMDRGQIRSIRPARGEVVDGRFWRADPNRTRLFFAPTARPLDRGEGYVASYMLFFPFMGYGVTDRFTMAGGTPIFPGIIGEVFYLAPKVTVASRPGTDLAVGALAFFATQELDEGSVGILYGSGTFGNVQRAFTAGVGWGFELGGGDGSSISNDPVFMLGGEVRTGENTKLLTENWFYIGDDTGGIVTGGIRFFGERLSADLGLGLALDSRDVWCCLPLVNFVYTWGRR